MERTLADLEWVCTDKVEVRERNPRDDFYKLGLLHSLSVSVSLVAREQCEKMELCLLYLVLATMPSMDF